MAAVAGDRGCTGTNRCRCIAADIETQENAVTVEMKIARDFFDYIQRAATIEQARSAAALAMRVTTALQEQPAPDEQLQGRRKKVSGRVVNLRPTE